MQKNNSFHINNYTGLFNALRLTLLILFMNLCLFLSSCRKSGNLDDFAPADTQKIAENAININTASEEELKKLPKVGEETAKRIIEHRGKYGSFRRPENLILVRGFSDERFREIKHLVKIE